ncbi:MAG: TonB-dependent receptor, partial [Deltaproteobacteria bacterium]
MRAKIVLILGGFFILFTSDFPVQAGITGKIVGTVVEADTQEPLPGVNIIVEGTTLGAASDIHGYFAILNVPPGIYTVTASMIGFKRTQVTGVRVSIGLTTTVNFKLESTVVGIDKVITIVAERPLIRKDLTSTSAVIGADEVAKLPAEGFQQVLQLQAGVVKGNYGDIHIRGGRASEVAYMVDGISVSDPFTGNIT